MSLRGKPVLVTGAARGLGLAIAERLAAEHARIWLADIDAARGREAEEKLRASGAWVRFVPVDIADDESVAELARAVTATEPLYGLVNNAALADAVGGKPFHEIGLDEWDRLMAVNVRGPWLVAKAFAPSMIAAGAGHVVNIASDAALYGSPRLAHYIASKGAVIALTKAMARELGAYGITVNSVAPGLSETESTVRVPAERHDLYRRNRALNRPQTAEDTAGVVTFLLGSDAGYITGQLLVVDGGFVFH